MTAKDTAERIRGLRTAIGMSQSQFAAMCGIEQGQLCNYELARIMPTIPLCERICLTPASPEPWRSNGAEPLGGNDNVHWRTIQLEACRI